LTSRPFGAARLASAEALPHYHWPTDTYEHVAPAAIGRALEAGRELLGELDRDVAP
jgi:hypothetical protein